MYKFHNKQLPVALSDFFKQVSAIHNYNTRHAAKHSYVLPKVKTNYGLSSVKYKGSQIWNSLNNSIKQSSLKIFKKFHFRYVTVASALASALFTSFVVQSVFSVSVK